MNDEIRKKLEKKRAKEIIKLLLLIFLCLLSIAACIFICIKFPELTKGRHSAASIIMLVPFGIAFYCWINFGVTAKSFENDAKEYFIPYILENNMPIDSNIKWISQVYEANDLFNEEELKAYLPKIYDDIFEKKSDDNDNNYDEEYDDDSILEPGYFAKQTIQEGMIPFSKIFEGFHSLGIKLPSKEDFTFLDDFFFGKYQGIAFSSIEADLSFNRNKSTEKIFKGLIIEIVTDSDFSPMLIKSHNANYPKMPSEYNKVNLEKAPFDIYTKKVQEFSKLSDSLYNYLLTLKNDFVLGLVENRIVMMIPSEKDMFKLGSIFKRLDDERQYIKFKQEFQFMLDIIGNLSRIINDGDVA